MEITTHLLESALKNKVGIDGSSVYGMTDVNNSDLVLAPDFSSFRHFPMHDSRFGNVALFMCNVLNPDGTPASGCTRSKLENELKTLAKEGFSKMNLGFEPEFFILKNEPTNDTDLSACLDNGSYADIGELDTTASIRREIMFELERVGIIPLVSHHERAPSSCEIVYKYSDALRTCDNLILGKFITEEVCRKHGLFATFEPKPFKNVNGSGLHTNISFEVDGNNVFATDNELSETANHFMAGVLNHASALCYLTTGPNGYKRLVAGYEAPTSICWGYHNRSAMIRVPNASKDARRIEIRNPDPTTNPYLCIAGILRAGMDGIKYKTKLPAPMDFNVDNTNTIVSLPRSRDEALKEFKKSSLLSNLITSHYLT